MRPFRFFLLALLLTAPALHALEVPPPPARWYTDEAGLLTPMDAAALDRKLEAFEKRSGAQFIVYVFRSIEGEAIEDFTQRCLEKWKVGQSKYDNGLALFVLVEEKKVRIETGYGLEGAVTDAISSRVIRETMAPRFQAGDWAGGLNAGVDQLIATIEKTEAPVPPLTQPQQRPASSGEAPEDSSGIVTAVIVVFIVFFVILPNFSRGRRRGSGCSGCFIPMLLGGGRGGGITFGGGGFSGGGFGGGGGFSGGGGSFGGGGATGGW